MNYNVAGYYFKLLIHFAERERYHEMIIDH